jgi:hypothetical protein
MKLNKKNITTIIKEGSYQAISLIRLQINKI